MKSQLPPAGLTSYFNQSTLFTDMLNLFLKPLFIISLVTFQNSNKLTQVTVVKKWNSFFGINIVTETSVVKHMVTTIQFAFRIKSYQCEMINPATFCGVNLGDRMQMNSWKVWKYVHSNKFGGCIEGWRSGTIFGNLF